VAAQPRSGRSEGRQRVDRCQSVLWPATMPGASAGLVMWPPPIRNS